MIRSLFLLLIVSCSNISLNTKGDYNDVDTLMPQIIDNIEVAKLDEAIKLFDDAKNNGKKWCLYRYKNKKCARRSNEAPKGLVKEIEAAKSCKVVLNSCEGKNLRRNDLLKCISDLKDNCKVRTANDTAYPNIYNKIHKNYKSRLKVARLGSSKMSKKDIARADQCSKDLKWSFYSTRWIDKSQKFYATNQGTPTGAYNTHSICEKNRKSTPKEKRLGVINDKCFQRYLGKDKKFCSKLY